MRLGPPTKPPLIPGIWGRPLIGRDAVRTQAVVFYLLWLGLVAAHGVGIMRFRAPGEYLLPGLMWMVISQGLFGAFAVWRAVRVGRRPLTWAGIAVELALAIGFAAGVEWVVAVIAPAIVHGFALPPLPALSEDADLQRRFGFWTRMLMTYALLTAVGRWIGAQGALREEESRAAEAEMLRAEAELAALRARLNPHFLFNTLHTLLALVRRDPAAAERGLEQFGQMMQYALRAGGDQGDRVSVADELRFTRAYVALESLRLGDRLRVLETVEEGSLSATIPALTLQPLVENAIRHGIGPRPEGGTVTIRSREKDGEVVLEVTDDGVGTGNGSATLPEGHGMDLVRRRLHAVFGDAARLELFPAGAGGFRVRLTIPEAAR